METWVIALALVVLGVIIYAFIRSSGREPVAPSIAPIEFEDGIVSEPVPMPRRLPDAGMQAYVQSSSAVGAAARLAGEPSDLARAPTEPRRVRWSRQFDPAGGTLSDEARLKLIVDLGLVRAAWSDAILEQALSEETDPAYVLAVRVALGRGS